MENRIVEIAQKKARHRSAKSVHTASAAGGQKPMFFGPPGHKGQSVRFPADIRPEKRAVGTTTLAFVLATPAAEIAAAPKAKSPPKSPAKRKARAKVKPRSKAKSLKKTVAKKAAVPPPAPVTPVPDLEPPFIPTATATAPRPVDTGATPVPRARAVALYRKNGLLDLVAYWLRGVTAHFRLPRKAKAPSMGQVLAENAALRREIARLRAAQGAG